MRPLRTPVKDLAETIRSALPLLGHQNPLRVIEAYEALSALFQRAEESERLVQFADKDIDELKKLVSRIEQNALSFHKGEEGKARALSVIADWCSDVTGGDIVSSEKPVETRLCGQCGHPREAHSRSSGVSVMDSHSVCAATIYEYVPHGMNAWPCRCRRFQGQIQ